MEIHDLRHYDFDTIFRAFQRAFSDYAITFDKEEVHSMLVRRGFVPDLSFAAFDNGEIVAFSLNGIGVHQGILTAYDTGTGTAPEYRGRHLAAEIFRHSLPELHAVGIRQYLLEVLKDNEKAISVYSKMGFEVSREFECFRQAKDQVQLTSHPHLNIDIRHIDLETVKACQTFCDFTPSWQNSFESIERGRAGLQLLGAFAENHPVGYCIFDPLTGDLTQIAVRHDYRRRGIGTNLLREVVSRLSSDAIKVLNISAEDALLQSFLELRNIPRGAAQYEMIRPI